MTMDMDAYLTFYGNQFQVNSKSKHERRNDTALLKKHGRVISCPCKGRLGVSNPREGRRAPTCGEAASVDRAMGSEERGPVWERLVCGFRAQRMRVFPTEEAAERGRDQDG